MKKNLVTAATAAGLIFTAFGASASAQGNTYTVQSGDTLSKIAKSNNVSISNLKVWNNLSSDSIYVNQKLSINYTVQSGDNLWAIAKSQGTTVSELKSANGLTTDLIRIGQQLNIPVSNVNASSASVSSNNNNPTTYVVQKGDSLSTIGARYHLTVSELKSMNQLTSNKIIIGRILELRDARAAANQANAAATATESQTVEQAATPASSQEAEKASTPANTQATVNQAASTNSQKSVSPAVPAASQTTNAQTVMNEAKKYIGTRYQWGGTSPSGFDCSGFVQYVFAKVGVSLPRTTSTQWGATTPVNSPSVGDLVFFETYQPGPSHVGIYLGNNQFISATDSGVKISDMTSSYWAPKYLGARKAV